MALEAELLVGVADDDEVAGGAANERGEVREVADVPVGGGRLDVLAAEVREHHPRRHMRPPEGAPFGRWR